MSEFIHTNRGIRWALPAVSVMIVVYFMLLVVPNLSQIGRTDDVVYLKAVQHPKGYLYYDGESIQDGVPVPRFIPHEHTPLYLQALSLIQYLLPTLPLVASRLLGVLCVLGVAVIIGLIVRKLTGAKWLLVCTLAFLAYLSNPLVIQSAPFLGIDTSVLPLLTMLFIYLCVKFWFHHKSLRFDHLLLLSSSFFLCLWAKETTPIALIGSLFVYEICNLKETHRLRNLASVIGIAGLGIGIWLLAWWWFAGHASIPFDTVFRISYGNYLLQSALPPGTSLSVLTGYLIGKLKDFAAVVLWLSPGFFALWVIDLGLRFKKVRQEQGLDAWAWMALYSFVVFVGYIVAKGTVWDFPKYHLPMVPVAAILVADRIGDLVRISRKSLFIGSMLVGFGWVLFSLTMGDPLFDVFDNSTHTIDELVILGKVLAFFVLGCVITLCVMREWGRGLLLGLAVTTLAWNLGLSALQSRALYSTTYHYGERGLEQVVELVRANTGPSDFILARKDIAFAAGKRYIQVDGMAMDQLRGLVKLLSPSMVVLSDIHAGASNPAIFHKQLHLTLDATYPHSEVIGDFILFAKDPSTLR